MRNPELKSTFQLVEDWFARHPKNYPKWLKKNPDSPYILAMLILNAPQLFDNLESLGAGADLLELIPPKRWKELRATTETEIADDVFQLCLKYGHEECKRLGFTGKHTCPIAEH